MTGARTQLAPTKTVTAIGRRRPLDLFSTSGNILTRGTWEVELADEYAGTKDRFFDRSDPTDRHVLTLNVYAIAPDHENGCGRVLLPNGSTPTLVPFDAPMPIVKQLVTYVADLLEDRGLDPHAPLDLYPTDVEAVLAPLASLSPERILK